MKINIKNKSSSNQRLCFVPKTGAEVVLPNPEVNPTINIHETGEVYLCLTPTKMEISCHGANEIASWALYVNDKTRQTGFSLKITVNNVSATLTIPTGSTFTPLPTIDNVISKYVSGVRVDVFQIGNPSSNLPMAHYIVASATSDSALESRVLVEISNVGDGLSSTLVSGNKALLVNMALNPTVGSDALTGTACLKYTAISCYGATSSSGCLDLEGDWDVSINDVSVATDINVSEMSGDLTTDDFSVGPCGAMATLPLVTMSEFDSSLADIVASCDINSYSRNRVTLIVPIESHETTEANMTVSFQVGDSDDIYTLEAPETFPVENIETVMPVATLNVAGVINVGLFANYELSDSNNRHVWEIHIEARSPEYHLLYGAISGDTVGSNVVLGEAYEESYNMEYMHERNAFSVCMFGFSIIGE